MRADTSSGWKIGSADGNRHTSFASFLRNHSDGKNIQKNCEAVG